MDQHDLNGMDQSSLALRLGERIRREGPLSFRDWMEAALYDSQAGYYCRTSGERWGRTGDYRTSPERSPLFAAAFASYFIGLYEELGAPDSWTIFEAGAGAGHFARGVMETLERESRRVFDATRYIIDERSEDARERAGEALARFGERVEFRRLSEITRPFEAGILFSNELLDALPVHRVTMMNGRLWELCVGLEGTGAFTWIRQEPTRARLPSYMESAGIRLMPGQVAEINLAAEDWLKQAAAVIETGYVITVDYGAEASELYDGARHPDGTLRAFCRHQLAPDLLARPGEQDLTTTIDWTQLKRVGAERGLRALSLEPQDRFLLRAGLLDQLERMTAGARSEADALVLRTGAREMILPGGMSSSFQVLVQRK